MTDQMTSLAAGDARTVHDSFDQLPVMITTMMGPDLRYAAGNAACRAFLGEVEYMGRPTREVFPELDGQQIFETVERVYATGEASTLVEWRFNIALDTSGSLHEIFFDMILTPLRDADGQVQGVVGMFSDVTARVRQRTEAEERAAAAERRYQAARDVVTELQQALLPVQLPVLPAVDVAARYLVAADDQTAGGDWFDVIPLPSGEVGLVVGDVVGHGVTASAAMGQLRAVLHRALVETGDIEQAIAWADRLAASAPLMRAATVCLAVIDQETGELRYCTSGHPPPLTVTADGASRYLPVTGSGPLGTGSLVRISTATLDPDAVLLLYSDGLIEQPGRPLKERMDTLAQVAGDTAANRVFPLRPPVSTAERVSGQCVEIMTRSGFDDDVTVLVAQRRRVPLAPLRAEEPATLEGYTAIRGNLDTWLSGLDVAVSDREDLDLAVTELLANAVEHAYPPIDGGATPGRMRLTADLRADGVVTVSVADDGHWQHVGPPQPTSGRGLWMAGGAVDHLTVHRPDTTDGWGSGTTVELDKRLTRPAQTTADPAHSTPSETRMEYIAQLDEGPPRTLTVTGSIDITSAGRFADRLDTATRGGVQPLLIDLDRVDVLASAGVSVLFRLRDQLATHGHPLTLVAGEHTPAEQVLTLVGLEHRSRIRSNTTVQNLASRIVTGKVDPFGSPGRKFADKQHYVY